MLVLGKGTGLREKKKIPVEDELPIRMRSSTLESSSSWNCTTKLVYQVYLAARSTSSYC
jgi:hypothetical protein